MHTDIRIRDAFRHTFITNLRKNNVPYEVIQPYVGHSNREMTEHYNHNKTEIDRTVLDKVHFGVI